MIKIRIMMKKIFTLTAAVVSLLFVSCEKQAIGYLSDDIDVTKFAQIRFVNDLPIVPSGTTYNITRLKYNDAMVSEVTTTLGSIIPNSAAKYHVVPIGPLKIDAYISASKDVLQYTNTINIPAGRWSAFVHNVAEAPLMVETPSQFPSMDPWKDTVCTIQFVNLLYKADGTPYTGKLFLKGRRGAAPYTYVDIAQCGFKEVSNFVKYRLYRTNAVWSGEEDKLAFVLFDEAGNLLKDFSTGTTVRDFSATGFTLTKGRHYIFHLNGKLGTSATNQSIRMSTITLI
jgi:hypothetical protein